MLSWAQEGAREGESIATGGQHQNDQGHHCVARALADEIAAAVMPRSLWASLVGGIPSIRRAI